MEDPDSSVRRAVVRPENSVTQNKDCLSSKLLKPTRFKCLSLWSGVKYQSHHSGRHTLPFYLSLEHQTFTLKTCYVTCERLYSLMLHRLLPLSRHLEAGQSEY